MSRWLKVRFTSATNYRDTFTSSTYLFCIVQKIVETKVTQLFVFFRRLSVRIPPGLAVYAQLSCVVKFLSSTIHLTCPIRSMSVVKKSTSVVQLPQTKHCSSFDSEIFELCRWKINVGIVAVYKISWSRVIDRTIAIFFSRYCVTNRVYVHVLLNGENNESILC